MRHHLSLSLLAACVLFAVGASGRMAYQLPAGFETILRARSLSQTFSCADRAYGFYADVDNGCQIFHVCVPVRSLDDTVTHVDHFTFMCGNLTVFSQDTLACTAEEDALPCENAAALYDSSNAGFGIIVDALREHEGAPAAGGPAAKPTVGRTPVASPSAASPPAAVAAAARERQPVARPLPAPAPVAEDLPQEVPEVVIDDSPAAPEASDAVAEEQTDLTTESPSAPFE